MRHLSIGLWLAAFISLWSSLALAQPAPYGPDKITSQTQAFVSENLAIAKANKVDTDPRQAASLVLMIDPAHTEALLLLARYRKAEEADHFYMDILLFKPDSAGALFGLGQKLSYEGYARLAMPYLKTVADQWPNQFDVNFEAGRNAFYVGNYQDCILYLDRALSASDRDKESNGWDRDDEVIAEAFAKAGRCHVMLGQPKVAATYFDRTIVMENDYRWDRALYEDKAFGKCKGRADSRLKAAKDFYDKRKFYEAYRETVMALQCEPKNPEALEWQVRIEEQNLKMLRASRMHRLDLENAKDGGRTFAQRQAKLAPASIEGMLTEGEAAIKPNETNGIIRAGYLASRVILMEPGNARARLLRARALNNLQIPELRPQAWADATQALAVNPKLSVAHFVRGVLLISIDDHRSAIVEYDKAIALDPKDMRFYYNRANSLYQVGQYDRALTDINLIIGGKTNLWGAMVLRGRILLGQKSYAAALKDFDAVYNSDAPAARRVEARSLAINVLDDTGQRAEADRLHLDLLRTQKALAMAVPYLNRRNPALVAGFESDDRAAQDRAQSDEANAKFEGFLEAYNEVKYCMEGHVEDMNAATVSNGSETSLKRMRQSRDRCLALVKDLDFKLSYFLRNYTSTLRRLTPAQQELLPQIRDLNAQFLRQLTANTY